MKRLLPGFLVTLFCMGLVSAQKWDWAEAFSTVGAGTVEIADIRADASNNIFVFGTYESSVSLNVAGTVTLDSYGSRDIFLAKFSSDGTLLWARRAGGTGIDETSYIRIDNQGNVYAVGQFRSPTLNVESEVLANSGAANTREPYIIKYQSNGNLAWAKRLFWGSAQDRLQDLTLSLDGNYMVMVGTFTSTTLNYDDGGGGGTLAKIGGKDQFVARYDTSGVFHDINQYSNSQQPTVFRHIHPCLFGGYYITGDIVGSLQSGGVTVLTARDNSAIDAMVLRVDNNLDFLWGRSGGYAGGGFDHINSSAISKYGNIYITGKTEAPQLTFDSTATLSSVPLPVLGGTDFYVAKYSSAGNLQWVRRKGTDRYDNAYGLAIFQEMVQTAGIFGGPITVNQDLLDCEAHGDTATGFVVYDRQGNEIAGVCIEGNNEDEGRSVSFDLNGETYVTGVSRSNPLKFGSIEIVNPNPGSYFGFLANYEYPFSVVSRQKNIACNGGSDGEIVVTPYYGVNPITYSWSHDPVLGDSIATNLAAGDYTVTVKDARDSTEVVPITLTQPDPINIASVISNVNCFGGSDGAINITVTGGTPPYGYSWNGPGVNTSSEDQANLVAGDYSVTVTDSKGCVATDDFTIAQPLPITFNGTIRTNIVTPPGCNGAVDLEVSGGTSPFGYGWTGPSGFNANTEDISGLCNPGNYTVVVTDANLCTADTTIIIDDGLLFFAYICEKQDVSCKGDNDGYARACTENSVGTLSYEWRTVPGGILVSITDEASNLAAGTYSVTVTDDASPPGSPSTVQAVIDEPASLPGLTYNVTNVKCHSACDGKIDLTSVAGGTPPYSYAWVGPGVFSSSSKDIAGLCPGNYSVTVTDSKGCEVTQSNIPVAEPTAITCNLTSTSNILCNGEQTGELCITVSGGTGSLSVLWDDPAAQTTLCAQFLFAGCYYVTVFDENGCSKIFGPYCVTEPPAISVVSNTVPPQCPDGTDGSIIITISGGTPPFDYEWYDSGNNLLATTRNLTNVGADTYRFVATDQNNCRFTDIYTLTEPSVIGFGISLADITECFGDLSGEIHFAGVSGGTAPYNYSVDNGVNWQSSPGFTGLAAGNYFVWVRDNHFCLKEYDFNPVEITQPARVELLDSAKTDITGCFGDATGTITLTGTGGTPPYTYTVNGGAYWVENGGAFTGLPAGSYALGVKDAIDCEYLGGAFEIEQPDELIAGTTSSTDPLCHGTCDGTITVTASGGTGSLEYSADGGLNWQPSNSFAGLCAGSYAVIVRDANLCTSSEENVSLNEPDELEITGIDPVDVTCGGLTDGSVTVTVEGGTLPYAFSLSPSGTQNSTGVFQGLLPGTYSVSVDDANGCGPLLTGNIEILGPEELVLFDAITPDGDEVNDKWNIPGIECYPAAMIRIFSPWGTRVFESQPGYPVPWDGKTGDRVLPAGTYYYILDLNGDGSVIRKGTVNIIK